MQRRGGKRIRMDEPPPEYEDHPMANLQEVSPEVDESAGPSRGRMTRLRARGGVRDRPPIIDDDDEVIEPVVKKRKQPRKERVEKHPRPEKPPREEREVVERPVDKERDVTSDESSLYYIVRHSKSAIATIVDDWIDSYKVDRNTALIALMQFFINASGCKGRITPDIQTSMEHTAIIRKMTEEFDEESGEYPLIMSGQQWKKFKMNFCDFVQTLVKQCQYSIIYDQFLMDNIISLLTGLSDSQVRAFRHTATLAAMKLMTALVDVALLVSLNFENVARQYDAEDLKTRDKRLATDRLDALSAKKSELEENMDEIKNMMTYMFKSVFVHRYRDTLPDIRAICMAEIGVWMQKFSHYFLDDSYLKYIGWTLHDKIGEVRLKCLQALIPLYGMEELKGKLELFTSKFKDRIVAMTLDKEFEVAVQAVKLVLSILKIHPDILADKDCEVVYELVYSSHRGVAQAAAEFLNVRLFHLDPDNIEVIKTKRGKRRLPNTPLIRDMVQFFIESELHEHGAYLVDSFIDNNPMVKDWECMTDLLLEEPGLNEEQLDNKQESTLIEIMVSSVRQCATGEPPVGRGNNRKITLNAKEAKQVQDDKQKLTEHFIQILPILLGRYTADAEKLTNLLAIPQYFNLETYTSSRQENSLQSLLDEMHRIMAMHHDQDVLETCAKTLEFLCSEGSAIFTRCDVSRSNIVDACVNAYRHAIEEWRCVISLEDELPDEEISFKVTTSLKKISILFFFHNLNNWSLFDSIFRDIEEYLSEIPLEKCLPSKALTFCVDACFCSLGWMLDYLEHQCENASVQENCVILRTNLEKYMNACAQLTRQSVTPSVQEAAYQSFCDAAIIFARNTAFVVNNDLVYTVTSDKQAALDNFLQTKVFSAQAEEGHEETKIEELHKRRNFLACFCKLIVYNIIPVSGASGVFKHYLKCYNKYGDIIKLTLGKAREINKINCALTMFSSLVTVYRDLEANYQDSKINKTEQEFVDLKELAKRFALSFGLDAVKNRPAIFALHQTAIIFAVTIPLGGNEDPIAPPPQLLFLEILNEFTHKLLKQDKRVILNFLDRRISLPMPTSRSEDWQPLMTYRNGLVHGEPDQPPVTSKRAYTRTKGRKDLDIEDDDDHEDGGDSDPDFRA